MDAGRRELGQQGGQVWRKAPTMVLVGSLLLTWCATALLSEMFHQKDLRAFRNTTHELRARIEDHLASSSDVLRAAVGLYAVQQAVTRDEFARYARQLDLLERFPGTRGIGYAEVVAPGGEAALAERLRAETGGSFQIWPELAGPAPRVVVVHIEPLDPLNQRTVGFDMASEPVRAEALRRARDEGQAVATGRVHLVQERGQEREQAGFLLFMPVYRTETVPATVEQRREQLRAFVYSPFRAEDLFTGLIGSESIAYEVYAGPSAEPDTLLRMEPEAVRVREAGHAPRFSAETRIEVAGNPWTLRFASRPGFEFRSGSGYVPWVALFGVLTSLVLYWTTSSLARARVQAEDGAESLRVSREVLVSERERFLTTLNSTADAVIATDVAGRIMFFSRSAERLTGRAYKEAVGAPLAEVVRVRQAGDTAAQIGPIAPVAMVLQRRQPLDLGGNLVVEAGTAAPVPVEGTGAPILDREGHVRGVVLVLRDVSERQEREARLREQARVLEVLHRIALSLSGELDEGNVAQKAAEAAREATGARLCAYLERVEPGPLRVRALSGGSEEEAAVLALPWVQTLFESALAEGGHIQRCDPWSAAGGGALEEMALEPGPRVRSCLAIPVLTRHGRVQSALVLGHPDVDVFQARHESIVSGIAAQAAVALEGARLFREALESEERYRFLAESVPQIVWTATPEGRMDYRNQRWADYVGAAAAAAQAGWIEATPQEDRETALRAWERAVQTGEPFGGEWRLRREDGHYGWHLIRALPQKDSSGRVLRWFGTATDIHDARRAREAVAQQAADLARSNAELQQFAYVASHDLQEPLRMVVTFTQLLERRYRGRLDPEADEIIRYAVEGGRRMQRLIRDLLEFSRAGRQEVPAREVDTNAAVDTVVEALRAQIEERHAVIEHAPLPPVHGRPGQVEQVFQNLISNALRFNERDVPRVEVAARRADDEVVFTVADNGIGMDPAYHDKVFQMFQRLHPRHHFPGSGIGLAICKKIVEGHGGRIWFDSKPGAGTTFYFSLPAA